MPRQGLPYITLGLMTSKDVQSSSDLSLAGAKAFVGLDRIAGDADYLGVQSLELRHGSRKVARLHRTGRRVVLRVEIKHHSAAALGLQIKVACRGGAFDVDDGFSDLKHC